MPQQVCVGNLSASIRVRVFGVGLIFVTLSAHLKFPQLSNDAFSGLTFKFASAKGFDCQFRIRGS
jgi:hypothetical protein